MCKTSIPMLIWALMPMFNVYGLWRFSKLLTMEITNCLFVNQLTQTWPATVRAIHEAPKNIYAKCDFAFQKSNS